MRTDKTIVWAPGKLMLFGELAVVHGKPCIVTSVDQRLKVEVQKLDEEVLELIAKDVGIENYRKPLTDLGKGEIPKGAKFVEFAVLNFYKQILRRKAPQDDGAGGVSIKTSSQFKSTFGFGSSSASAVCTIKALAEIFNLSIPKKQIFDTAYKTVLDVQGVGSGFDVASAVFGGTLYFKSGGRVIKPLKVNHLPLIVGYTGVKADTATLVKEVNARGEKYPKLHKSIFEDIAIIVEEAKVALQKNNLEKLGELMNLNQGYLEALGVGSKELSSLIYGARGAGAFGAKLSGAGGGDCMIALAPDDKIGAVERAIKKAGGQVLKVEVNAEGVLLEG